MLEQFSRTTVLAKAVKAMKAGTLSVREGVAECKAQGEQGVQIEKSTLNDRKNGVTVRDKPGAPPKLPENLVKELVTYNNDISESTPFFVVIGVRSSSRISRIER